MRSCIICGVSIDDNQFRNFNGKCSECSRLKTIVNTAKAKEDAGINLGLGLVFTLGTIMLIIIAITSNIPDLIAFSVFTGIIASLNWYFYSVNNKLAQEPNRDYQIKNSSKNSNVPINTKPTSNSKNNFCLKCGHELEQQSNFCKNCGNKIM